jgi:hypothetical protein
MLNNERKRKQDSQCTYKHKIEACSHNHCSRGKAVSIARSECGSAALVILDAKRKLRLYSVIQKD